MFQKSQKITKLIGQVEEKLKYSFGDWGLNLLKMKEVLKFMLK